MPGLHLERRYGDGGKMIIKRLHTDNLDKYNKLVDISAEGTIFHKTWWLNIFKYYYGTSYSVNFYGVFENDELVAGMPIPKYNKFGMKYIYFPKLTPYLGSIFLNKIIEKKYREISWKKNINTELAKILGKEGTCLYYCFGQNHIDMQPFIWQHFDIGVRYTYVLKLDELDAVWMNLDRKRRNNILKSYKQNYIIKSGEIDRYIEMNEQTMKRQNHAILNEKLWKNIFDECKKNNSCEVFTVYINNEVTAALFLIWDAKRSYYIGGGIKESAQSMMSLLIWEAIKYTKEKLNLNEFDFEGSSVKSIESYFREFGGDIKPIFSISEGSIKKIVIMKLYYLLSGKQR